MLKQSLVFGAAMGVYSIASVYVIVSLLPPWFGISIPVLGLAGAGRRLLRRLGTVVCAVPVAAFASFAIVLILPGFIDWSVSQHRQALERRGVAPVEIERQIAQHRQTPSHFLVDGALMTAMPGVLASLVTSAAGAILLRQRPPRP